MTYYEHSDEYLFEYDTTGCGTGWSSRCFYSSSSSNTAYSNWKLQWTTTPVAVTAAWAVLAQVSTISPERRWLLVHQRCTRATNEFVVPLRLEHERLGNGRNR